MKTDIIILILVLFLTVCQAITIIRIVWNRKQSKCDYSTPPHSEYGDNDLSKQIQKIINELSKIKQELNHINEIKDQITGIYDEIRKIEQFVDSFKNTHNNQIQDKQEKTDSSHVNLKKYYVGSCRGEDLFTDIRPNDFPEAKFEIKTNDDKTGYFKPLDVKKFKSIEVNETVIRKTNDSCDFNEATNMNIEKNGDVKYDPNNKYWRIKTPCVVKLTK